MNIMKILFNVWLGISPLIIIALLFTVVGTSHTVIHEEEFLKINDI